MNTKTLKILEFHKICEILEGFAITEKGKNLALSLLPMHAKKQIQKAQSQTSEAVALLYRLGSIPISEIASITISLKQLENSNSFTDFDTANDVLNGSINSSYPKREHGR